MHTVYSSLIAYTCVCVCVDRYSFTPNFVEHDFSSQLSNTFYFHQQTTVWFKCLFICGSGGKERNFTRKIVCLNVRSAAA